MSALIRVTFELAITLTLSYYSVTTFSTKVNANNDVMEAQLGVSPRYNLPWTILQNPAASCEGLRNDHNPLNVFQFPGHNCPANSRNVT